MNLLPLPLLTVTVLAPLVGALAVLRTRSARVARLMALTAIGCSVLASSGALWFEKTRGGIWAEPWALPLFGSPQPVFTAGAFNSIALVVFALLALATVLVSPRRDLARPRLIHLLLIVSATFTVYAANHLLVFLLGWTLASLPFAFSKTSHEPGSTRAALLTRIVMTAALAALAAGIVLIGRDASAAGLADPFSLHALANAGSPGGRAAFALLMIAVLLRKGIFPVHSWVVSSFDRGSMLNTGLFVNSHLGAFLIARLAIPVLPDIAVGALPVLSDVALFTMLYTAVLALKERSPRRLLGLLFVGQASSILVGLESATEAGVTGALVHWIVVAASTTGLVAVLRLVETRVGGSIGGAQFLGLANNFPRLAVFFLISGLALIGLPGTLGFCAEDLLIHGTLESHPQLGVALPIATALFAFHLFRLFSTLFLGTKSNRLVIVPDALPRERACLAALAAFLILLGIAPAWIVNQQATAATALVQKLRRASDHASPTHHPIARAGQQ